MRFRFVSSFSSFLLPSLFIHLVFSASSLLVYFWKKMIAQEKQREREPLVTQFDTKCAKDNQG